MNIYGKLTPSIQALAARVTNAVSVRWGGPQIRGALNGTCKLLDGLEQLQVLAGAGVPCPQYTSDINVARAWVAEGLTVAGRMRAHTQGKDIVVRALGQRDINNSPRTRTSTRTWETSDYWVRWSPSIREWRMHVMKQNTGTRDTDASVVVIGRALKVNPSPPLNPHTPRSRRLGWVFRHDIASPEGLRAIAKQALSAVGYDFGAIDILELGPNQFMVLEVNSRPALRDEYTLTQYARAFSRVTS